MSSSSLFNPARILVVEDESIIAFNLQETLESLGYAVPAITTSGEQAIQRVTELRPNLVLMDIRLKGTIDGIQAAQHIWNRLQIPVIFVTGHSDKSTVERATLTAPFGYLLKPIKERELYVAIESALQRYEREQWLAKILNSIGDGVAVINADGMVQFLNPAAEVFTGWTLEDATDRAITEVVPLLDEQTLLPIPHPAIAVLQQGHGIELIEPVLLRHRDGTAIPIIDNAAPLQNSEGQIVGAVLVFRNITAQRLAEERNRALQRTEQLELYVAEMERLQQLKDDFLSTVSHELRSPLTNIKMSVQMLEITLDQYRLREDDHPASQSLNRYLNILRDQCDQEFSLITDLLDLQRLDAETYSIELTPVHLSTWVPRLLEGFAVRAQSRQLQVRADLAAALPPLLTDPACLERIFAELLTNACKYTPSSGTITVSIRLEERLPAVERIEVFSDSVLPNSVFLITVCNTGSEIEEADLTRIFEPFYRIPKSDRWNQGGTGLGLALIKKLVAQLKGTISVSSQAGETCFILEFPDQPIA